MKRIRPLLVVVFAVVALVGLLNRRSKGDRISAESPRAELEKRVGGHVGVKDLSLAANGVGEYTGVGVTANGRSLQVHATRKGDKIVWRATSWTDDGRTLEVGGGSIGLESTSKPSSSPKR